MTLHHLITTVTKEQTTNHAALHNTGEQLKVNITLHTTFIKFIYLFSGMQQLLSTSEPVI
jgi:hypothetical protein